LRSDERSTLLLDGIEILDWATRFFGHGDGSYECPLEECAECDRGLQYTRIVLGVIDQA
jgi:hypothetical protein